MKSINEPCVIIDFATHPKVLLRNLRESERLLNEVFIDETQVDVDAMIDDLVNRWFTPPKK